VGVLSLARLIPGLESSALASWVVSHVNISEGLKRFPDYDTVDTMAILPSLLISSRFDLASEYPFSMLGISGELTLSVEAYPWYGAQLQGASVMPSPFQLTLTADYAARVEIVPGLVLKDVYVSVVLKPVREFVGASKDAVFTVGGAVQMKLGQDDPLLLSASISITQGSSIISFQALLENWENALGIDGLTLSSLQLFGTVARGTVDLSVEATWALQDGSTFALAGAKQGDAVAIGVHIEEFTLQTLIMLMQEIFGGQTTGRADRHAEGAGHTGICAHNFCSVLFCSVFCVLFFLSPRRPRFHRFRVGVPGCVLWRVDRSHQRAWLLHGAWCDVACRDRRVEDRRIVAPPAAWFGRCVCTGGIGTVSGGPLARRSQGRKHFVGVQHRIGVRRHC
jgi:hypothetical protein